MLSPVGNNAAPSSMDKEDTGHLSLHWSNLKSASSICEVIKKALGESESKIIGKPRFECEVLFDSQTPLGFFIYKRGEKLPPEKQRDFKVKKMQLLKDSQAAATQHTVYYQMLLKRIFDIAECLCTKGIIAQVSNDSPFLDVLLDKNFRVQGTSNLGHKKLYYSFASTHKINQKVPQKIMLLPVKQDLQISNSDRDRQQREMSGSRTPSKRKLECIQSEEKTKGKQHETHDFKRRRKESENKKESESKHESSRTREASNISNLETPSRNDKIRKPQETHSRRSASYRKHRLPMKGTIYFDLIMKGEKQFEGRVCGPACQNMHAGDILEMFDRRANWGIECVITSKDVYPDFEDMLRAKGVLLMLPQLKDSSKHLTSEELIKEGTKIYRSFPGADRVRQYGAVAIGVKFLRKV